MEEDQLLPLKQMSMYTLISMSLGNGSKLHSILYPKRLIILKPRVRAVFGSGENGHLARQSAFAESILATLHVLAHGEVCTTRSINK